MASESLLEFLVRTLSYMYSILFNFCKFSYVYLNLPYRKKGARFGEIEFKECRVESFSNSCLSDQFCVPQ